MVGKGQRSKWIPDVAPPLGQHLSSTEGNALARDGVRDHSTLESRTPLPKNTHTQHACTHMLHVHLRPRTRDIYSQILLDSSPQVPIMSGCELWMVWGFPLALHNEKGVFSMLILRKDSGQAGGGEVEEVRNSYTNKRTKYKA